MNETALEGVTRREFFRLIGRGAVVVAVTTTGILLPAPVYGQYTEQQQRIHNEVLPKLELLGKQEYRDFFINRCQGHNLDRLPEVKDLFQTVGMQFMDSETHEPLTVDVGIKLVDQPVSLLDYLKEKVDNPAWSDKDRAYAHQLLTINIGSYDHKAKQMGRSPLPEQIRGCETTAFPLETNNRGYLAQHWLSGKRYEVTMQRDGYRFRREVIVVTPAKTDFEFLLDRVAQKVRIE